MASTGVRRSRLPGITTGPSSVSHPAALPLYSFAVPPLPPLPESFEPEAATMSLLADRTAYRVSGNEAPAYRLTNATPHQPILWTLSRNGITLVKDQAFDAVTDGDGAWAGTGSAWKREHEGLWEVVARTGEQSGTARFLVQASASPASTNPVAGILGVSHVAGRYRFATPGSELRPVSFLVEGARLIFNLGARHLFVHLSPQYQVEYPFDEFGSGQIRSLRELVASPHFREMLELPFECVVLTTYSFANWDWLMTRGQAGGAALDLDGEQAEIKDLVQHLLATYPGKRFVIKNWEGDWQLKQSLALNAVATEAQVAEFIAFLGARQAGVARGRDGDLRVQFAIEFNLIHLAERGQRCMLSSVIPEVESDLLAYSSWWTLAKTGPLARRIADDLAFVRSLPGVGSRPLIVTEFGFPGKEAAVAEHTRVASEAFAEAGVPMAIYWQIFDNLDDIGLVGKTAERLPAWHTLRALAGAKNDAEFLPGQSRVPERVAAGSSTPVRVAIRNKGVMFDPVLGYALGLFNAGGELLDIVWLREEVARGATVEVRFSLRAPREPGPCTLRLFQHGVELFGGELVVEVGGEAGPR